MPCTSEALHLNATRAGLKLSAAQDELTSLVSDLANDEAPTAAQIRHAHDRFLTAQQNYFAHLAALLDMDPAKDENDADDFRDAMIRRAEANEAARPDLLAHDRATYLSQVA